MLKRSLQSAAAALALFVLPGTAIAGPGVCDRDFDPNDQMIKFCQGLNVGIGSAEIQINRIVVSDETTDCQPYYWEANSTANGWKQLQSYPGKCSAQFSKSPEVLELPVYLKGDKSRHFFDDLAHQAFGIAPGDTLPATATFLLVGTRFSDSADLAIAIATTYKTTGQGRKYDDPVDMGVLCPNPITERGTGCKTVGPKGSPVTSQDADPNGWDAYQILSGSGQSRQVKVTYGFDVGGGTKATMSWQQDCMPTSLYVQSARAHFNLIPHNDTTVDFCACSSFGATGQCN